MILLKIRECSSKEWGRGGRVITEDEKSTYERNRGQRAWMEGSIRWRGSAGPGECVVTLLPTERAEVGAFVFAMGAGSVTASDVPVNA